ncbi:YHYH domain-containing protein [Vibrio parahaemolyticus]
MFAVGNIHAQPINSISQVELSHSGGTDKCGCHYNRKTGKYHCHTRKQRGGSCPP